MPKGPQGQRRPADVVGCAVTVAKIATGEITEPLTGSVTRVPARRAGGLKGGKARAKALTPERRSEIARIAGSTR